MAEQENPIVDDPETVAEVAEEVVPRMFQRHTLYVVDQEFTHKRKQTVGSIFRPRRYPRLRPIKLRELIAGGFIRPATDEEIAEFLASKTAGTRINPSSKRYVAPSDAMLLGSDVQPATLVTPEGVKMSLGDVVREGLKRAAITVEDWNELDPNDRESLVQAVVDELKLEEFVETEAGIEHVGGGWYEVTVGDEVQKVQGQEAAETLLAELTGED